MKILHAMIPLVLLTSCQPKADEQDEVEPVIEVEVVPIDVSKTDSLVGLSLEKAEAACDAAEVKHRVIEIDGKPQMATKDFRPERLNFAVKDGIVVAVTKG